MISPSERVKQERATQEKEMSKRENVAKENVKRRERKRERLQKKKKLLKINNQPLNDTFGVLRGSKNLLIRTASYFFLLFFTPFVFGI